VPLQQPAKAPFLLLLFDCSDRAGLVARAAIDALALVDYVRALALTDRIGGALAGARAARNTFFIDEPRHFLSPF